MIFTYFLFFYEYNYLITNFIAVWVLFRMPVFFSGILVFTFLPLGLYTIDRFMLLILDCRFQIFQNQTLKSGYSF